jgi:hypothetical protein
MTVARPLSLRMGHRGSLVVLAALLVSFVAGCGGRRSEQPPSRVPVMAPPPVVITPPPNPGGVIAATTPAPTVIGTSPDPAPRTEPPPPPSAEREPVRAAPPRPVAEWDPAEPDQHGYAGDRYVGLLTPEEVDILRLRSRGDLASHLSRFLTEKEKENLRRREAELTEIGADPLRIGE